MQEGQLVYRGIYGQNAIDNILKLQLFIHVSISKFNSMLIYQ